jgi:hypothetical protein
MWKAPSQINVPFVSVARGTTVYVLYKENLMLVWAVMASPTDVIFSTFSVHQNQTTELFVHQLYAQ